MNPTEWPKPQEAIKSTAPTGNLTNIFSEINDRKSMECNIIIYGAEECNSADRDERIKHDTNIINEILHKCNVGPQEEGTQGKKSKRLGRFDKDTPREQRKDRPLLVALDTLDIKSVF